MLQRELIWLICVLATLGVLWRPFRTTEAVWAAAGALALVASRLITPQEAWAGVAKGGDVYLFLAGMMLLAETARDHGLFDWLASHATRAARGSSSRLFLLIYGVGVLVTALLSNDATAVVLTPAIAAAVKTAEVADPLPFLLTSAFVANAASFLLPVSNPANLVLYASRTPPLFDWARQFAAPSVFAVAATYLALRWTQRAHLRQPVAVDPPQSALGPGGLVAAFGVAATTALLLVCSARGVELGLPTAAAGAATLALALVVTRASPWPTLKAVSWSVLPLVASLFVLVEGLGKTALAPLLSAALAHGATLDAVSAAWGAGTLAALISNAVNNLPASLLAGEITRGAQATGEVTRAMLIGVDLGPNLSVTGSLATILWLAALRKDGVRVGGWSFLKLGLIVMPPALLLALGAALLTP